MHRKKIYSSGIINRRLTDSVFFIEMKNKKKLIGYCSSEDLKNEENRVIIENLKIGDSISLEFNAFSFDKAKISFV